jgi:hypothetical protein
VRFLGHTDIALLGSPVLPGRYAPLLLSARATGDSGSMRAFVILCSGFVVRIVDGILGLAPCIFKFTLDLLKDAFDLEWAIACQLTRLLFNGSSYLIHRTFYSVFVHRSTFRELILVALTEALEVELCVSINGELVFWGSNSDSAPSWIEQSRKRRLCQCGCLTRGGLKLLVGPAAAMGLTTAAMRLTATAAVCLSATAA